MVINDHPETNEECVDWEIPALHIAYPGTRRWCSGRARYVQGLVEAEQRVIQQKKVRPRLKFADG